jgi:phosphoribosyl-ATP pyrophosphohydrolase/phosphoribosyl-AMP cyclohydrolase
MSDFSFLSVLEDVIEQRLADTPQSSYTARLAAAGVLKVAQKVGEEGVELALAGAAQDADRVTAEAADLVYHLMVLLELRGLRFQDVVEELQRRHTAPK